MDENEEITNIEETPVEEKKPRTPPQLGKEKELELFKLLAYKSLKEVGYDYGLHHYYDSDPKIRTAVLNIANRIRKAPELWGISEDAVAVIDEAVRSRSIKQNPEQRFVKEIEQNEFKDKLEAVRDKAVEILNKKLEKMLKRKDYEDIKLKEIADVLSMAIDKHRLVKGESTDNVVHFSKMDMKNVSPEQALQLILKAREAIVESNK